MDSPLGFKRGQNGVANDLPPMLEAEGIRSAWQADTLHPLADWTERMAAGTLALWLMQLRRTVDASAGSDGLRFKALAWAERDDQRWELPLPVTMTDNARALISGLRPSPAASGCRSSCRSHPVRSSAGHGQDRRPSRLHASDSPAPGHL